MPEQNSLYRNIYIRMKKILLLVLVLSISVGYRVGAQTGQTDAELANQYMSTGEYEKALMDKLGL